MKISEIKAILPTLDGVRFILPQGNLVPVHFHITEVGVVTKHFIDCGGTERKETVANFQLWEADDYDHRLAPQKLLAIIEKCSKIFGNQDLSIEVEYQQATIAKFGLEFNGQDFLLTPKTTACLAEDACGIPSKKPSLGVVDCSGSAGCC